GGSGEDHLPRGQRAARCVPRVHVPDGLAQLADVHPPDPVTEHVHAAAGGVLDRTAQAQDGALARPVGAEQRPVLTGTYRQVDIGEDLPAGADEVDGLEPEDLRTGPGPRVLDHSETLPAPAPRSDPPAARFPAGQRRQVGGTTPPAAGGQAFCTVIVQDASPVRSKWVTG